MKRKTKAVQSRVSFLLRTILLCHALMNWFRYQYQLCCLEHNKNQHFNRNNHHLRSTIHKFTQKVTTTRRQKEMWPLSRKNSTTKCTLPIAFLKGPENKMLWGESTRALEKRSETTQTRNMRRREKVFLWSPTRDSLRSLLCLMESANIHRFGRKNSFNTYLVIN
ncbi:CLUMA_CG011320, isoform A [Clunio marinus]|uniref:CLUMA_CG011320, isoform A n=1 Tax=Clunio marinus TaxID=568069 RepID=A0A1J1ICM1_9DIPT|nr:CLUMA_CG011320, isoform A [Clunio marinus]